MDERFEELRVAFPEFFGDYTPPWGLPTADDFAYLATRYEVWYPPSFVRFQTHYAALLPVPPDSAFRWANRGLEPYLSIEATIVSARQTKVPVRLVPFWQDEGNFTCFDTGGLESTDEPPVAFWDHDSGSTVVEAADFIAWLEIAYRRWKQRLNS